MIRVLSALAVVVSVLTWSSQAIALTPRVALCGRVTSFIPSGSPSGDDIVRLGTQEPRHLSLGGVRPRLGEEICIWGIDVVNVNPPAPDPAPKGIVGYRIAPIAFIGCADLIVGASAIFNMPGEATSAVPNGAFISVPLLAPAGDGCARLAVDAQGNPVAAVIPRAANASLSAVAPASRPTPAALPGTSAGFDGYALAIGIAFGLIVIALIVSRAITENGRARSS